MNDNLINSIVVVCNILNKYSVQYIIVGGAAVALHGHFRYSVNATGIISDKLDLDLWYNPTYKNYFNLLNALEELGQDVARFRSEQAPNPRKSFFRYEFDQFTLDLLPTLKAPLRFVPSFNRREVISLKEIDIPFISYDDLIFDKEANARLKDITDIEQLRRRKEN